MSAVLHLYALREGQPTTVLLETADGPLSITWSWAVDRHEIEKVRRCSSAKSPWRAVLEDASDAVDCQNATIVAPDGGRP